jgi:hypothetical protein
MNWQLKLISKPEDALRILISCCCMGLQFSSSTYADVSGKRPPPVLRALLE